MLLHELHPSVVHAPLALLPAATVFDVVATVTGEDRWARTGRALWVVGTGGALLAGLSGLAASQEVRLEEPRARDMAFVHGSLNALVTLGAVGVTAFRLKQRPTVASCVVALGAVGVALYTATLGGKMVYELGVGIDAMPADASSGTLKRTRLLSPEAPRALLRDGVQGVRWLINRARSLFAGHRLAPGARGFGSGEEVSSVPGEAMARGATLPATQMPTV
jgi:uncharacterized membrane protein